MLLPRGKYIAVYQDHSPAHVRSFGKEELSNPSRIGQGYGGPFDE